MLLSSLFQVLVNKCLIIELCAILNQNILQCVILPYILHFTYRQHVEPSITLVRPRQKEALIRLMQHKSAHVHCPRQKVQLCLHILFCNLI